MRWTGVAVHVGIEWRILGRHPVNFTVRRVNTNAMLAAYANVGPGIAFMLAQFVIGLACLFWIAIWLRKGFRSRGWHNSRRVRIRAGVSIAALMILMIGFPPFRRVGSWTEPTTKSPLPRHLENSYDRAFFGYIPTYAWIGRCASTEVPETSSTMRLAPSTAYHLDTIDWRVDWIILAIQFVVTLLFAFPFLVAQNGPEIGEQSDARETSAQSVLKSKFTPRSP